MTFSHTLLLPVFAKALFGKLTNAAVSATDKDFVIGFDKSDILLFTISLYRRGCCKSLGFSQRFVKWLLDADDGALENTIKESTIANKDREKRKIMITV